MLILIGMPRARKVDIPVITGENSVKAKDVKPIRAIGLPRGAGYAFGVILGIPISIILSVEMGNLPLGMAWLTSAYAVGFSIEAGDPEHLTKEQEKRSRYEAATGMLILVITIITVAFTYINLG